MSDRQESSAATRPESEPIYVDPYTRIAWLHEENEQVQGCLLGEQRGEV